MEQMPQMTTTVVAAATTTTTTTVTPAVERQLQQEQQQQQQQVTNANFSTATSTYTALKMAHEVEEEQQQQQQTYKLASIEATIIDIPAHLLPQQSATAATKTTKATSTIVSTPACNTLPTALSSSLLSSSSASSSSYDTDSSVASSTCCTRHGEHIYMQRMTAPMTSTSCANIKSTAHAHHAHHHHHQQHNATAATTTSTSTTSAGAHVANDVTALHDGNVHFKADYRKSWPIFILLISIIEIIIFVYDLLTVQRALQQQQQQQQQSNIINTADITVPIPTDSVFIYRPDRRLQVWRFVSYMFLHANWFHLGFNVVVQLFYGIPLEVMHGSARVATIYCAGVFAGSLGTSVVDSEVYLVGASGGVYALLAAHLANITLNYSQMKYAVAQLFSVVIFVSCDLGYALYTQYLTSHNGGISSLILPAISSVTSMAPTTGTGGGSDVAAAVATAPPVSYIAHLTGALAGLTIGLLVLKNFEQRAYENVIWWLALGVYCAFTVFAIVFNLINTVTGQLMEEQGGVITQHLLHDLGVS